LPPSSATDGFPHQPLTPSVLLVFGSRAPPASGPKMRRTRAKRSVTAASRVRLRACTCSPRRSPLPTQAAAARPSPCGARSSSPTSGSSCRSVGSSLRLSPEAHASAHHGASPVSPQVSRIVAEALSRGACKCSSRRLPPFPHRMLARSRASSASSSSSSSRYVIASDCLGLPRIASEDL